MVIFFQTIAKQKTAVCGIFIQTLTSSCLMCNLYSLLFPYTCTSNLLLIESETSSADSYPHPINGSYMSSVV